MKIDTLNAQRGTPASSFDQGGKIHGAGASDTDFATELGYQDGAAVRSDLEAMLKEIDRQGARLTKTPTYDELKAYRDLVKNFVNEAVGRMYSLHVEAGWDRMGRQKVYSTVRKIDRKMEEMAEKIRLGQASSLDVVASHDAIRGMLVDLYM